MKRKNGFTFVELLVVVTIIAVITGIAAVSYNQTNKRSRDTRRKADIEQIRSALEICRAESGAYPASIGSGVVCATVTYMAANQMPKDPKSGNAYSYSANVANDTYSLCSNEMEVGGATYCVNNP